MINKLKKPIKQYRPSKEILEKYAKVMVNFGVNQGKGIKKGDTVLIRCPECAKPLLVEIHKEILKKGGCEVEIGVMEDSARELNKRFFTYHEKKRPYIILKWAQTQDNFLDKIRKPDDPIQPNWITNQVSKRLVHKWRTQEQAILVGSKTAVKDDPSLNVREWAGNNPKRFLIDRDFEVNSSYKLIHDGLDTVIFIDRKVERSRLEKYSDYNVTFVPLDFSENLLRQIIEYLYEKEILSIIIEGGSITLSQFISESLWDEARVFIGDKLFYEGIKAPLMPGKQSYEKIDLKSTKLYLRKNAQ